MGKLRQYQTAVACSLGSLVMGLLNVWPSYTTSLYTAQNTTLLVEPMSEFHASLLGSLPSLGAMIGTAITSVVIDRLGRKHGGVLLALPYILCWVMKEVCKSSMLILIARLLGGIAGGSALVYAPIFISEIAESSIRGTLAAGPVIFYSLGALFSYVVGWTCDFRTITYLNLVVSIINAVFIHFVVESPVYLLKKNREEEARKAIAQYRNGNIDSKEVLEELSRLKQQITPAVEMITVSQADPDTEEKQDPEKEKLNVENVVYEESPSWKLLLVSPSTRRALLVVGVTLTLQVFMGMVTVQVNAKEIFHNAAPDLSPHMCSVLFALVLLTGCTFTATFADKAGRRVLILSSSASVAVCMSILGFLMQTQIGPPILTAVVMLVYCFCFSFGSGTVPYVLLAECFISEVQGIASMLLVEWVWFLNFFVIAVFPFVISLIDLHGVFYFFAIVAVFDCVLSYIIVPETKGLSLDQIQEALLKKHRS